MTRRQTLNAFAWWRDWWNKLSPFEQFFVEIVGAIGLAVLLLQVSMLLWPE
jgi:hypothetical protein